MTVAQQLRAINSNIEVSQKAREFVNLARALTLSRGDSFTLQEVAHANRVVLGPRVKTIIDDSQKVWTIDNDLAHRMKAAVSAGTTTDASWALPLAEYQTLAGAFLESLRNSGAFDRLLPFMRRVPFRVRVGASTVVITGSSVAQASAKPISNLSLTSTQIDEQKVAAVLVVTEELARFGGGAAGDLFAVELANAVAVATDSVFISALISGATSIPSSGTNLTALWNDVRDLLAAVTTGARSSLFLLTTSAIAKTLSASNASTGEQAIPTLQYNGGTIAGITVVVSDGVPSGNVVLVDASQIVAASESIRLDSSREAIVHSDSVPDSPPSASTVMTSLWQLNMLGLKAERTIGVEKLTTTGVAVITGAGYEGGSP